MNEENSIEEVIHEGDDVIDHSVNETKALTRQNKKMKKNDYAKKLVAEAKSLVKESEKDVQDCKLLLEEDINEYIVAKTALKSNGLDEAMILLSSLGDIDENWQDIEDDNVIFEAKEELKPLVLKEVRSGRFTGLLLSLVGGLAMFGGLVYWATQKLGITLDILKVPENESIEKIFGWFGTQVGQHDNVMIGSVAIGMATLAVMALIYFIRVWLKSGSNMHFAKKQMKETQRYLAHKTNCKAEMDRVDVHIRNSVDVLKDYEILLGEQVGKLKRIFHFENGENDISNYEKKSVDVIHETQHLIQYVNDFIATPMSQEGRLSENSIASLEQAKEYVEKLLMQWR